MPEPDSLQSINEPPGSDLYPANPGWGADGGADEPRPENPEKPPQPEQQPEPVPESVPAPEPGPVNADPVGQP